MTNNNKWISIKNIYLIYVIQINVKLQNKMHKPMLRYYYLKYYSS